MSNRLFKRSVMQLTNASNAVFMLAGKEAEALGNTKIDTENSFWGS